MRVIAIIGNRFAQVALSMNLAFNEGGFRCSA